MACFMFASVSSGFAPLEPQAREPGGDGDYAFSSLTVLSKEYFTAATPRQAAKPVGAQAPLAMHLATRQDCDYRYEFPDGLP
jgi:hypothetical protein